MGRKRRAAKRSSPFGKHGCRKEQGLSPPDRNGPIPTVMRTRNVSTNKKRRLSCLFVAMLTVVGASAVLFVGYKARFFFIVPGMVFLMFAVAAIGIIGQACCEIGSRRWPKTVGSIRRAGIARSYIPSGGMHAGNSSPSHAYSIDVEYDYAVGGKRHKGSRITFLKKDYSSWKEADHARRLLLKDENIDVYFCPQIPSLSCIAHVPTRDIAITVSAAVATSAVSLLFTLLAFHYLP